MPLVRGWQDTDALLREILTARTVKDEPTSARACGCADVASDEPFEMVRLRPGRLYTPGEWWDAGCQIGMISKPPFSRPESAVPILMISETARRQAFGLPVPQNLINRIAQLPQTLDRYHKARPDNRFDAHLGHGAHQLVGDWPLMREGQRGEISGNRAVEWSGDKCLGYVVGIDYANFAYVTDHRLQ